LVCERGLGFDGACAALFHSPSSPSSYGDFATVTAIRHASSFVRTFASRASASRVRVCLSCMFVDNWLRPITVTRRPEKGEKRWLRMPASGGGLVRTDQHEALELLASATYGCTVPFLLDSGCSVAALRHLARRRLAIADRVRVSGGPKSGTVVRFRISKAGRQALQEGRPISLRQPLQHS
jgi:hypothetical protein